MRLRTLPAVGIGVAALVLSTTVAGTATAANPDAPAGLSAVHKSTAGSVTAVPDAKGDCFSSLGKPDGGNAISSQIFPDFGNAGSFAADDFKCKSKKAANRMVTKVKALGQYYNGTGPADSFNVTVYKNDTSGTIDEPGKKQCSFKEQTYKEDGSPGTVQMFTIPKRGTLKGPDCALKRGDTYWLEVQAVMSFDPNGQWGWEVVTEQSGNAADWHESAEGLFGTACLPKYEDELTMQDCIFGGDTGVPDFAFSVT